MKRKRYSAEHTVAAVKQHEMGVCGLLVSDALSWEWWETSPAWPHRRLWRKRFGPL